MRIANGRSDAVRQHTAVELAWGHQRALAVHMTVDEPGNRDPALRVDLFDSPVAVERANDGAAAHCNVARLQLTGDQVQQPGIADDQVCRRPAQGLIDLSFQQIFHATHLTHQPPHRVSVL